MARCDVHGGDLIAMALMVTHVADHATTHRHRTVPGKVGGVLCRRCVDCGEMFPAHKDDR